MDLATTTVFLDFDGTISTRDVGLHLLQRHGAPGWEDVERQYVAGRIGSRECLVAQWSMLPTDEDRLRATAREVPLDPAFGPLVSDLRSAGAEVVVVSDGFGFHAGEALAPFGVDVVTNAVDWERGTLEFPHADRCCPCSTCGTCKQAPLEDARRRGRTTVFVGDGASDRKAALLAGRLFAKSHLADWCEAAGVPFTPFTTLADVHRELLAG